VGAPAGRPYREVLILWSKNLIKPIGMDFTMMTAAIAAVMDDEQVDTALDNFIESLGEQRPAFELLRDFVHSAFNEFKEADVDRSGTLDSEEISAVLQSVVNSGLISAEKLEEMGSPSDGAGGGGGDGKVGERVHHLARQRAQPRGRPPTDVCG